MVLFSVFFGGLRGIFRVGLVDPSSFSWVLVPSRSLRVSLPCFDGVVFGI